MITAFISPEYSYFKLYDVNGEDLSPISEDRFENIFGREGLMDVFTDEDREKSKKKTYIDSFKVNFY